jgi:hypothetical protein
MKLRARVVLQLAALCFVLAAYGFAADDDYLYIVHGIPGRDQSQPWISCRRFDCR